MPSWKKVITSGSDAVLNSLNTISSLTSSGDFKLDGAFYDNNNQPGTPGQILILSSSSIIWSDNIADQARDLVISGKNMTLSTIEKGTPLYFSGSGVAGNVVGVYPADAGNPARMPAGGVAGEQLIAGAEGDVYIYGFINGVDTSAFNSGDDVFVGVGGGYTNVKPTGSALIQKLGNVEKVDAGNGSGVIQGPSWYNDLPNIQENYVWLGDSNGVPQAVASSSLTVNTASYADFALTASFALTADIGVGYNRRLTIESSATTWSFAHNLGNKYPQVMVFDSNDELIIPGKLEVIDDNNLNIYFDTPQAGTATATVGGTSLTASYANTLVIEKAVLDYSENLDVDTGTETIATVSTLIYDGAFIDYVLKDGTNYRAGTISSVWSGSTVEFTDFSTQDIGDTSSVTMSMDISGSDARLRTTVSSDNWIVKTLIRAL